MRPRFYWWPFLAVCALAGWALLAPLLALAQVGPLPVVGKWGVIGKATVNVNTLGDTPITITDAGGSYILGGGNLTPSTSVYVWVGACSGTMTTFQGSLWTGPGATGTQLIATTSFANATATTLQQKSGNVTAATIFTKAAQPVIYFNVSLVQGSPGTCTVWLIGALLPP